MKMTTWGSFYHSEGVKAVLAKFQSVGGEQEFLKYLWEQYPSWKGFSKRHSNKSWKAVYQHALELKEKVKKCPVDIFSRKAPVVKMSLIVCANELEYYSKEQLRIKAAGRPAYKMHQYYWCMALFPYFEYKLRTSKKWEWLAEWLQIIIGYGKKHPVDKNPISLKNWWKKDVVWKLKLAEFYNDDKIDFENYAFNPLMYYIYWKGGKSSSGKYKRYLDIVYAMTSGKVTEQVM